LITAVDTNVLLDVLIPGAPQAKMSVGRLGVANAAGSVILSPVVLAEIGACFPDEKGLEKFVVSTGIRLVAPEMAALYMAGHTWADYSRRREGLLCAACGAPATPCARCGTALRVRQHILSDFLIGAHALCHADQLLTRDRGYYRTYFPTLVLVE
jgi:hypothetical protein